MQWQNVGRHDNTTIAIVALTGHSCLGADVVGSASCHALAPCRIAAVLNELNSFK